ncbi:MAG TPA: Vms1/Ankzf1 family peptidyl-tRNA hydrolase [Actinomycetota bacterium]|nr:Vms1/Ankzf1 family peptidyl-tRNA hydrolase [Actinomycetota bacterium]
MATLTPKVQQARLALLNKLSRIESQQKVLSVYLDLDPSEFATPSARESQVKSVLNEAAELVEQLDDESKASLRKDVELVRDYLIGNDDWSGDARSVAVFASSGNDLFDVVKLPEPIERGAFIDHQPHVLPMKDMVSQDKWLVALVDRRSSRLLVGSPIRLKQYDETEEDVHGQHDQGGWSQGRYARAVEEEVEDHLKNLSDRLLKLHKSTNFDHIVIGASDELWPRLVERLHPYVAEDVIGRIDVDIQNADIAEIQDELRNLEAIEEQQQEESLLEELRMRLANDSRAASGLTRVLETLNEARVERLLIAEGFDAEGTYCPKCGFLSEDAVECPVDGQETVRTSSIIDKAIERVEELSAESTTVRSPSALTPMGSVAALLRF